MIDNVKELIEQNKYQELKKVIAELNEADIAEILEEVDDDILIKVFRLLPKNIAAETFAELEIPNQQLIINSLTTKEAAAIIDEMAADDATDLIEEMPSNVVKKILSQTTVETRKDINHLLHYPLASAGSIMTVEFLDIKENVTVSKALSTIRRKGANMETLDTCFVLDKGRRLKGTISLTEIVLASPNKLIKNIMEDKPICVSTLTDQEEVASMFQKYDMTVMPVVDSEERLVGIITVDDIMDIMEEETTEDIEKMAAIVPTEKPYLQLGLFDICKSRLPWLLFLMISATFTSRIIASYEASLASYAVLTLFIPMIMDTGGNAGGQSSVTIIRSLSLKEVEFKDSLKVLGKELLVGLICGLVLAICNFGKLLLVDRVSVTVALIVCLALLITVVFAKIIGSILPILASKVHLDPAVMANPIITTIVDALSLIIYFQVASHILGI